MSLAEVQARLARGRLFPTWLAMTVNKIETKDCTVIDVNCAKGRHRSVAAAELLRTLYYPQATVEHLTIR